METLRREKFRFCLHFTSLPTFEASQGLWTSAGPAEPRGTPKATGTPPAQGGSLVPPNPSQAGTAGEPAVLQQPPLHLARGPPDPRPPRSPPHRCSAVTRPARGADGHPGSHAGDVQAAPCPHPCPPYGEAAPLSPTHGPPRRRGEAAPVSHQRPSPALHRRAAAGAALPMVCSSRLRGSAGRWDLPAVTQAPL